MEGLDFVAEGLLVPVLVAGCFAAVVLAWAYVRAPGAAGMRFAAWLLKLVAIAALLFVLVEPVYRSTRPRPGANLFVILGDNSQSMLLRDQGQRESRGSQLKRYWRTESTWHTRLGQDFDLRIHQFDTRLKPLGDAQELTFDGRASMLVDAVKAVRDRYRGRPVAGILLMTDGNSTDAFPQGFDFGSLPPIYPVVSDSQGSPQDIRIERVTVNESNFEAAPITIQAEVSNVGYANQPLICELFSENGEQAADPITIFDATEDKAAPVRFRIRPPGAQVAFYRIRVHAKSEPKAFAESSISNEATLLNNERLVAVNRRSGPYRVLYVGGRPNWEYKFLNRAVQDDPEVSLAALIRIALKEPKFDFRSRSDERTNPLYRGFGNKDDDSAEQYNEPVLLRQGIQDDEELRDGFPKAEEDIYRYDAIILDEVEAKFFTVDQLSLIQSFVSQRGGGFMMLAGADSFWNGGYEHTPIAELLPVYLDRMENPQQSRYRFLLTREGQLQPWLRLRSLESEELRRLEQMPPFQTLNRVRGIKPGSTVFAEARELQSGDSFPAVVTQRFGKGQAAAILVGDLWRWHLRRDDPTTRDPEKAWRQTIRWLVSDVPRRVELEVQRPDDDAYQAIVLAVRVKDEVFKPLENATVEVRVRTPDGEALSLRATASDLEPGAYHLRFVPGQSGAHRASVTVTGPDGALIAEKEIGWAAEPAREEFDTLAINREQLSQLASETGGEVLSITDLNSFVSSIPNRKIPITEPWTYPLWHHWSIFLIVSLCLAGEWGLRRWKGLP